jgi:hypothetical protein
MCISHRLQCKVKSKINQEKVKILKIPTVDNFRLINSSQWYNVYKNPTIHILDTKYGQLKTRRYVSKMITKLTLETFLNIYVILFPPKNHENVSKYNTRDKYKFIVSRCNLELFFKKIFCTRCYKTLEFIGIH